MNSCPAGSGARILLSPERCTVIEYLREKWLSAKVAANWAALRCHENPVPARQEHAAQLRAVEKLRRDQYLAEVEASFR
jgi:hypothetical protein